MSPLPLSAGRAAFGGDPAGYHAARPPYPDWVFARLRERCGLRPGAAVFEVGPGTGIASARLLAEGADPLVGVEPDARLADHLARSFPQLEVRCEAFEANSLPSASFDLGLAATSFHWVEPAAGHAQAARVLKPGGGWALVWNQFSDPGRPDPFHEATFALLNDSASPSAGEPAGPTYAEDGPRRTADLAAAGFTGIACEIRPWTLVLDPPGVRALYATYSGITARPDAERDRLLDALQAIAAIDFAGRVERNMLTVLWSARR